MKFPRCASNDLITAILLVLHMRILFIAGFGPIPDYLLPTKKLYSGDLEIEFHEYEGGYMHAQKLMAAKGLSCTGPLIH